MPGAVPYLLDLVNVKSSLPSWMKVPLDLEAKTKTREVIQAEPTAHRTMGAGYTRPPSLSRSVALVH